MDTAPARVRLPGATEDTLFGRWEALDPMQRPPLAETEDVFSAIADALIAEGALRSDGRRRYCILFDDPEIPASPMALWLGLQLERRTFPDPSRGVVISDERDDCARLLDNRRLVFGRVHPVDCDRRVVYIRGEGLIGWPRDSQNERDWEMWESRCVVVREESADEWVAQCPIFPGMSGDMPLPNVREWFTINGVPGGYPRPSTLEPDPDPAGR